MFLSWHASYTADTQAKFIFIKTFFFLPVNRKRIHLTIRQQGHTASLKHAIPVSANKAAVGGTTFFPYSFFMTVGSSCCMFADVLYKILKSHENNDLIFIMD